MIKNSEQKQGATVSERIVFALLLGLATAAVVIPLWRSMQLSPEIAELFYVLGIGAVIVLMINDFLRRRH